MEFPTIGSYVKLFFKTGITAEGRVVAWSNKSSVLQSDNGNKLIINKTSKNVILILIINKNEENAVKRIDNSKGALTKKVAPGTFELKGAPIIDTKITVDIAPETSTDLRKKKLIELRAMQDKTQQEELRHKMKTFTLTAPTEVNYEYPTRPGIVRGSATQITERATGKFAKLRDMQRQKTK